MNCSRLLGILKIQRTSREVCDLRYRVLLCCVSEWRWLPFFLCSLFYFIFFFLLSCKSRTIASAFPIQYPMVLLSPYLGRVE